jgi:hypothetical protein
MFSNIQRILQQCVGRCRVFYLDGRDKPFFVFVPEQEYMALVNETGLVEVMKRKCGHDLRLDAQAMHAVSGMPLTGVAASGAPEVKGSEIPEYPNVCFLDLLGAHVWVRCKHRQCLEDVLRHFSCNQSVRKMTPDVIVECDWERADRALFRSRPASSSTLLDGIRVQVTGHDTEARPWASLYPPLPPFDVPPFKRSFVGLHSAAVVASNGEATLLVGSRGSGKSTLAIDLVNHSSCALLTDETVFLHRRTLLVEPFPIAIGVKTSASDRQKKLVPASDLVRSIARRPALVARIVILSPGNIKDYRLEHLSEAEGVRELLTHHLDVGADADEAIVTILQLATQAEMFRFRYGSYNDLFALPELLFPNSQCQ